MKFTQIPAILKYPKKSPGKFSKLHSDIITAFSENCRHTKRNERHVIKVINVVSHLLLNGDAFPDGWSADAPLTNINTVLYDESTLKESLGALYVSFDDVEWDITDLSEQEDLDASIASNPTSNLANEPTEIPKADVQVMFETPKEDLWLKPREIPRFESPSIRCQSIIKNDRIFQLFQSLPQIPVRQRDITIHTDVNRMTERDVDKLYPKQFIRTRKPCMYEPLDGVYMHEKLGLILKINGFSQADIVRNIIQYPHLYIIRRVVGSEIRNFFADIEIDGNLYPIIDVWDTLEDTKNLPKTREFMQEYVIRRYLLERDIKHVEHKYPMDCNLQPYLTLFMPKSMYAQYGFTKASIGRDHVRSRVAYLRSLNPMLRNLSHLDTPPCIEQCPFADQCTDQSCDGSCPKHVEFTYLLERNRIITKDINGQVHYDSPVFQASDDSVKYVKDVLHQDQKLIVIESTKIVEISNLLAYVACCEKWKGNCLNCSVYHLDFSDYTKKDKESWNSKDSSDALEYMKIWMEYAPILIISDIDCAPIYDIQASLLISLLRSRERSGKKTIIVSPKVNNLNGKGQFYDVLKKTLREAVIR